MEERSKRRFSRNEVVVLALLFAAWLVVGTGIQMQNVLFPSLSRLMGVPVTTTTLLVSVVAFTGLLSPLFGVPSDRYGHGTFMLIGLGTYVLGNLLCAVAPNFPALVAFQVVAGLGYAIFGFVAWAVMGDVFVYEIRGRAAGIVRISISVAALAGVPAAAAIADWATARASFATVGVLGLLVFVALFVLRLRLSPEAEKDRAEKVDFGRMVMGIIRRRSAMASLLAYLLWITIPTGVFIYLAAWLEQKFQLAGSQIGLAFSMIGVGGLIGNALTAQLADRLGKKRSAVIGFLVLSVTIMVLPHSPGVVAVLVGLVIFVAAMEFSVASFVTLMTELVPQSRGALMSLVNLLTGLGTGVVPLVMAPLWVSGGYTMVTLVLGVVGLSVVAIIGLFVIEREAVPPMPAEGHTNIG